jgi:glutaconate CoA-transferase subunit A
MSIVVDLRQAIGEHVKSGMTVAMEGFTHLIPHAAGHEIIRQGLRDLHVIRMTPDVIFDQLIGAGCVRKLTFSWGGNPGVGSLHRFRDAVENAWPRAIAIEEHSHAGMAARYSAGASGLPFGTLRGYRGTDLLEVTENVKVIDCPFTGERITTVRAITPDVSIVHAQRADRTGNVQIWGIIGVQKEALLSAKVAIATVEEVVEHLDPRPGAIVLPGWVMSAVACVPGGAHPSFAMGYSERDNDFYKEWDGISSDRDLFQAWIEQHVLATSDHSSHLRSIGKVSDDGGFRV